MNFITNSTLMHNSSGLLYELLVFLFPFSYSKYLGSRFMFCWQLLEDYLPGIIIICTVIVLFPPLCVNDIDQILFLTKCVHFFYKGKIIFWLRPYRTWLCYLLGHVRVGRGDLEPLKGGSGSGLPRRACPFMFYYFMSRGLRPINFMKHFCSSYFPEKTVMIATIFSSKFFPGRRESPYFCKT